MTDRTIADMLKDRAGKKVDDPTLVLRKPKNLSPSALFCLEKTPIEFFFRYMFPEKQEFAQTRPMAAGSAFDGRVKEILALRQPKLFDAGRFGLLKFVLPSNHGDMDLKHRCNLLAEAYCNGPPGKHHKKHKPVIMEGSPELVDIGGVPVYGKVDVQSSEPRILDFKVSGFNSSAYPVVGYVDAWDFDMKSGTWTRVGAHDKGFRSLTETKEDWALQLVTYDMIRTKGASLRDKSPIGVDQVSFHPNGAVRFTWLREEVPVAFKKEVVARYQKAWRKVQRNEVIPKELRGTPVAQLDLLRRQIVKF